MLTDEQIGRLLTERGRKLSGWSIALVLHPLAELADGLAALRGEAGTTIAKEHA